MFRSIFLIVLLLSAMGISAQKHEKELFFTKRIWENSNKSIEIISNFPKETVVQPLLVLNNHDSLFNYRVQQYILQELPNDTTKLSLLVGVTQRGKFVSVADVNNNNNFIDDPVYTYKVNKADFSQLPKIGIPSIHLKDKKGLEKTFNLLVSFSPNIFTNNLGVKNPEEVQKNVQINFYPIHYYGADFQLGPQHYEMALIPFPLSFDYFDLDGPYKPSFCALRVYQKRIGQKDTAVYLAGLRPLLDATGNYFKMPIPVGVYSLVINGFSFSSKTMRISIDSASKKEHKNIATTLRQSSIRLDTLLDRGKFLLIEFTGTWCAPCRAIMPRLNSFYNAYGDKVNLVSVFVESGEQAYIKFLQSEKLSWKHYLEIKETQASDLNKQFGVNVFPSLLLIDPDGKVILRAEGEKGLNEVVNFFNN